jgi:UTP--glucose-1-phosphate uridylyltransferase
MKVKTAVFPVGGLGTRFLPATKSMPKEMLPVFGKPIIQYAFEEAKNAGIERFIFVTGRNKNTINNHFDKAYELEKSLTESEKIEELNKTSAWLPKSEGSISFIRQGNPKGLGHAIYCAKNFINEPFLVILADEMVLESKPSNLLKNMLEKYHDKSANIISVCKVEKKDVSKYGIISRNDSGKITNMIEKPNQDEAPSNLAISGRYNLKPEIFSFLEKQKNGKNGELQLTDAMNSMINNNHNFYYSEFNEQRFDCGNPLGYLEANIAYAKKYTKNSQELKKIIKKYYN